MSITKQACVGWKHTDTRTCTQVLQSYMSSCVKGEVLVCWEKVCCPRLEWWRDTNLLYGERIRAVLSMLYFVFSKVGVLYQATSVMRFKQIVWVIPSNRERHKCERHFIRSSNYSSMYYASSALLIWPSTNMKFLSFLPPLLSHSMLILCSFFALHIKEHPLWYTQSLTMLSKCLLLSHSAYGSSCSSHIASLSSKGHRWKRNKRWVGPEK